MIVSHIVAVSKNWVIGKENKLPWRMPTDMAYFQRVTMGHYVIMGRKNYEANENKALPGRTNVVITRQRDYRLDDSIVVYSVEEALDKARQYKQEEVFIVGGGEIYRQSLKYADRLYITMIDAEIDGDAYYPVINFEEWKVVSADAHEADDRNPYNYTFYVLERPDKYA